MNIGVVGLGLIGGSLARTAKLRLGCTVYGTDLSNETMAQARLLGAIDGVLDETTIPLCDLILVAIYPAAIIQWITSHASLFAPNTLIIDCGGVKQVICQAVEPIAQGQAWHFIGGHPMAGRQFSGFKYAKDDLFDRASMILTPAEGIDVTLRQRARDFFMDMGFRRVQFTTPQTHDEMIAYTSQLAHIVSSAYVKTPLASKHKGFSAGSFADMTRVAYLNENMWTELFFDNADALLPEVQGLIDRLTDYRDALQNQDEEQMRSLLREGRLIKEELTQP